MKLGFEDTQTLTLRLGSCERCHQRFRHSIGKVLNISIATVTNERHYRDGGG